MKNNLFLSNGLTLCPADLMALANALQGRFEQLGAPSTQNVRNPIPMRRLVVEALPNRMSQGITAKEVMEKIKARGFRVLSLLAVQQVIYKLELEGVIKSAPAKNKEGMKKIYAFV